MPKSIRPDMPVVDPLEGAPVDMTHAPRQAHPQLNSGEDVSQQEPFTESTPRAVVRRDGQEPEVLPAAPASCPAGHMVSQTAKFCPECGQAVPVPGPLACRNGHEVRTGDKFCATCGVPLSADAIFSGEPGYAPRDEKELSQAELAAREAAHRQAIIMGKENPNIVYAPGQAPAGAQSIVVHFLVDGFTAFGNVWMRGQEVEVWPGHPRWREAQDWITLDVPAQYRRYGRQVFGQGPWPGLQTYTAGAGKFQRLKTVSGEGEVAQPTEDELARADEAERRRGRRVPMPLG